MIVLKAKYHLNILVVLDAVRFGDRPNNKDKDEGRQQ